MFIEKKIQNYNIHDANNIKGGEWERQFTKVTDNATESNC